MTRAIGNNSMRVTMLAKYINQETNEGKDKSAQQGRKAFFLSSKANDEPVEASPESIGYQSGLPPSMWDHQLF